VAPVDIFNSISTNFVNSFPEGMLPDQLRGQALDMEFHWVNETGKLATLTAGGIIQPTVSAFSSTHETLKIDSLTIGQLCHMPNTGHCSHEST
jgi:hypothetical protein